MTKRPEPILRAERLRAIMSMPEYALLIGAWLKEAEAQALHQLKTAFESHEIHRAQGAVTAVQGIIDRFDLVFSQEKAALRKKEKTND